MREKKKWLQNEWVRKRWLQKEGAGKVATTEIVEKANPGKKGQIQRKKGDI